MTASSTLQKGLFKCGASLFDCYKEAIAVDCISQLV